MVLRNSQEAPVNEGKEMHGLGGVHSESILLQSETQMGREIHFNMLWRNSLGAFDLVK